jgi:hypothetical protein
MTKRKPQTNADDLLTSSAAAEIAGLNRSHFSRLLADGKGPPVQRIPAGKRHLSLIRRGDLMAWIEARQE